MYYIYCILFYITVFFFKFWCCWVGQYRNELTPPNLGISVILYGKVVLIVREFQLRGSFKHEIRELAVYVKVNLPHTCHEITGAE
jgi:hypothetical protein